MEALAAVRMNASEQLEALVKRCTPFQRWCLGAFLLEIPGFLIPACRCFESELPDLSGAVELDAACARFRTCSEDQAARAVILGRAVY